MLAVALVALDSARGSAQQRAGHAGAAAGARSVLAEADDCRSGSASFSGTPASEGWSTCSIETTGGAAGRSMLQTFSAGSVELRSKECSVYPLASSEDGSFVAQVFLCTMQGTDYAAVTAVALRLDGHDVYISNKKVTVDGVDGIPAGILAGGKLQSTGGADLASSSGCHRVNVNTGSPKAGSQRWWHNIRISSTANVETEGGGALCATARRLDDGSRSLGEPLLAGDSIFTPRQVCELCQSAACEGCTCSGSESSSTTSQSSQSTECDVCGEEAPADKKEFCCKECFKTSFCEVAQSG